MSTVTITEAPLRLEDLLAIVAGARVRLADGVRSNIAASRAVVDRALASNEAVYGMTTQVGHGKDTRLSEGEIGGEQLFVVMSHSGGIGRALLPLKSVPRWPCGSMGSPAAAPAPRQRSRMCW